MKVRNFAAALAALTLTAAPVLAETTSVDLSRALAPLSDESQLEGDNTLLIVLGVLAAGLGIYLIADSPSSP